MISCFGIGEHDDNEKKWEVLRKKYIASTQNGIINSQIARSTHDASCSVWLQAAGVLHSPTMYSKSV